MLKKLSNLPFAFIWPGEWEDVGFTEREIWVNNKGYGYIMCDEPTQHWEGPGLGTDEWTVIKEKITECSISFGDIKGTSLENMLRAFYYDDSLFEDDDELCTILADLALSDYPAGYFYASLSIDGINYFETEEAYRLSIERDWADEYWEEMDDDLLATWIERLKMEGLL